MKFTYHVIKIFRGFLLKNESLLKGIEQHPFVTTSNSWQFTLPALHAFLKSESYFCDLDYLEFKQQLFHSSINNQLKSINGEIIIIDNKNKVDTSTYALIQVNTEM